MKLSDIIKKPIVSEKSLLAQQEGRYTFQVDLKAGKNQIRQVIKDFFNVKPTRVWTKIQAGKTRRTGTKRLAKTYTSKKIAIVQLEKGQKIDLMEIKQK